MPPADYFPLVLSSSAGNTTLVFLDDAPASLNLLREGLRALQEPGEETLSSSGFQQLPPASGAALVQPSKAAVVTVMALAAGLLLSLTL
jgi:hypothetical protein